MTDTRSNVLLRCLHSVLSMIRDDAAAGHVVLVECHNSMLSIIRAVHCSGVVSFFLQILYLQVPRIDIAMDWLVQHRTDQYMHHKSQEIHSFMLAFFSVPSMRIFCALLSQAPSLS